MHRHMAAAIMRRTRKTHVLGALLAGAATTALLAGTVGTALADPPAGVIPNPGDVVGVGAPATANMFDQFSYYPGPPNLYSFDAVNPVTGAIGDTIITKSGCTGIPRPDGSSAGITALTQNAMDSNGINYCIDYARSSVGRTATDPPYAPGGVAFVALAGDAVTWASDAPSDAPASLTTTELAGIYECTITNWDQIPGDKNDAPIQPFLPQTASGVRAEFLTAIDVITPGACVSDDNNTLQENDGINPVLDSPEAIVPYSVAAYLAQRYHSGAYPGCVPSSDDNLVGCDVHGSLQLNKISGSEPTTPWPLTGTTTGAAINPGFDPTFQHTVYDVVRYDPNTADHIPGPEPGAPGGINLEQIFGASGWLCSPENAAYIQDYGFLPIADCGSTS
jgi:ABC-type phosphate transport system substrate-binding protein